MAVSEDDIVRITNEVILGKDPSVKDDAERRAFRRKIRRNVKAIIEQGWIPEAPKGTPDPNTP